MRALSAFFLLSLLVLFSNLSDARKDPADYWKSVMKGEPMPKSMEELIDRDPSSLSKDIKKKKWQASYETINMDHFKRDFDARPNLIIYHSHIEPKKAKPVVKDFKLEHDKKTEITG